MTPFLPCSGALLCLALLASPAAAQQPAGPPAPDAGVMLNFQEADLRMVIGSLAASAGLMVSYSGLPAKTVTLTSPVPVPCAELRPMLESLVRANGLTLVEEGRMLRIAAAAPAPAGLAAVAHAPSPAPGGAEESGVRLYVYRLRHTRAETIAQTLRDLFGLGSPGQRGGAPDARTGSEPRYRLPNPLAPPPAAEARPAPDDAPRAGAGTGLAAQLHGSVQIVPDAATNALLIRADAGDYRTLRSAVEELDTRPLQVLIEVLIAEVKRDRSHELGLSVSVPEQTDRRTGVGFGGELRGGTAGSVALQVLGLGGVNADVTLRALAASSRVSVLSRPIVLAQNNQEARILVGDQRPFVQISRALPTDGAVRDQVIQYRDVGTQLTITPTVNPDGYVTLQVKQEVSGATQETQFGAPVIRTREVETQLMVRDAHTAVMGGLVDDQRESGSEGVPVLKDIPLLGSLFRSTSRHGSTTELFILLTPHVIRTDDEMDRVTGELKEGTGYLGREIDRAGPLVERAETPRRKREP